MLCNVANLFLSPHWVIREFFLQLFFPSWTLKLLLRQGGLIPVKVTWHFSPHKPLPTHLEMTLGKNKEAVSTWKDSSSPLSTQILLVIAKQLPGDFHPFVSVWKLPWREELFFLVVECPEAATTLCCCCSCVVHFYPDFYLGSWHFSRLITVLSLLPMCTGSGEPVPAVFIYTLLHKFSLTQSIKCTATKPSSL